MPLMAAPSANACCFHMVGLFTYTVVPVLALPAVPGGDAHVYLPTVA